MSDKELRERVEAILHLNGCQQRTSGYNEAIDGKDLDMEDTERLEYTTLNEVMALFTQQLNKAVVDAVADMKQRFHGPLEHDGSYISITVIDQCFNDRIATLKQQLKDKEIK